MKLIKKLIGTLSLIAISININAQTPLIELPFTNDVEITEKTIVYPVYDKAGGNINLFFTEGDKISCEQYDKAFKENSFTSFEYEHGNEYKIIDYFTYSDTIELIYSNKSKTTFDRIFYNQKTFDWGLEQAYNLDAGFEYIVAFDYKNQYYVCSIKKGSSIIGIHSFVNGDLSLINEFDYSKTKFDMGGKNLYDLLSKKLDKKNKVKKINNDYPGGLLTASITNKAYQDEGNIKITIDNVNDKTTVVLNFNLDEFSSYAKIYPIRPIRCLADTSIYENKSTSFISKNILAQLNVCENQFVLSFLDLNTDSILNEYIAKNDAVIDFKYQDNVLNHTGTNSLSVELIRSKMLLRKMSQKNFATGITMYRNDKQLYTTIGAVSLASKNKNNRRGGRGGGRGTGGGNGGSQKQLSDASNNSAGGSNRKQGGGNRAGGGKGRGGKGGGNGSGTGGGQMGGNKNGASNESSMSNENSSGKGGGNGNGTGGGAGGENKAKKNANGMKADKIKGSDELINFDDYSRKRATYMKSIFDTKNAIQLIPKLKNVAFDKIKTYKQQNFQIKPLAETIYYSTTDGFVYAYFNPDTKKYVLLRFGN